MAVAPPAGGTPLFHLRAGVDLRTAVARRLADRARAQTGPDRLAGWTGSALPDLVLRAALARLPHRPAARTRARLVSRHWPDDRLRVATARTAHRTARRHGLTRSPRRARLVRYTDRQDDDQPGSRGQESPARGLAVERARRDQRRDVRQLLRLRFDRAGCRFAAEAARVQRHADRDAQRDLQPAEH